MYRRPRFLHPEAEFGEICLGNVEPAAIDSIGWKSKRLGIASYDKNGSVLPAGTMRPLMVRQTEIEAAGCDLAFLEEIEVRLRNSYIQSDYAKPISKSIPRRSDEIRIVISTSLILTAVNAAIIIIVLLCGEG